MGINGGVVYNPTQTCTFDLDYFRAQMDWYAVINPGVPTIAPKQVINVVNGGMTINW
jgi:hypothetical protein